MMSNVSSQKNTHKSYNHVSEGKLFYKSGSQSVCYDPLGECW